VSLLLLPLLGDLLLLESWLLPLASTLAAVGVLLEGWLWVRRRKASIMCTAPSQALQSFGGNPGNPDDVFPCLKGFS
jgi:hypothetical protein